MTIINTTLDQLQLGAEQTHGDLIMMPLLGRGLAEADYLLLDQALESGTARVTEISDAGSVPTLRFENDGDRPVLLLDGEELVGAKQNRILNLSVLAPANQTIEIPVSCVEAGRWSRVSAEFSSAKRAHYAAGRARKAAQVSLSLSSYGSRLSDQSDVWADISEKSARMQTLSHSGAAAALYENWQAELADYEAAFQSVPAQLGVIFVLDGKVISLDLFDCSQTCAAVLPKLIQSCALDALDARMTDLKRDLRDRNEEVLDPRGGGDLPPRRPKEDRDDVQPAMTPGDIAGQFLSELVATPVQTFEAVGLGEDLRLEGKTIAGGALQAEGCLVHLCAFQSEADALRDRSRTYGGLRPSRMARPSRRRSSP